MKFSYELYICSSYTCQNRKYIVCLFLLYQNRLYYSKQYSSFISSRVCQYFWWDQWKTIFSYSIVCNILRSGRFPGISRNAENHGNNVKFHKSNQILNQNKRNNKLHLRKISRQETVTIKLSVYSWFSNMLYGKKRKPKNMMTYNIWWQQI